MSTTIVPLLVTAGLLVAVKPLDGLTPELGADAEVAPAELPATLEEPGALELAELLLLQAATLTTKDAATQPAVHLRMRI